MLQSSAYLDWNNSFDILNKAYDSSLFVLIIGPKGTGKTTLVRDFANSKDTKLESINFSLRTRESHLIGTKTLTQGTIGFDEGILIRSMKEGSILYLDELNAAEADVLLRLDEALDDRRQIILKESTGETINAKEASGALVGKKLSPELIAQVAKLTSAAANPKSDHRGSSDYKRHIVEVFVTRILTNIQSQQTKAA